MSASCVFASLVDVRHDFRRIALISTLLICAAFPMCASAGVATVTNIHNFKDGSVVNDGYNVAAPMVMGADGNLYGVTTSGGASSQGTVFKTTYAGIETILYSFGASSSDGAQPSALTLGPDGNFYGTTSEGGSSSSGTVFKITPQGAETVIYTFLGSSNHDGASPGDPIVLGTDGNLYGTTTFGGAHNYGIAYSFNIGSGSYTILHSFADGLNGSNDGGYPQGLTKGSDGNYYGTSQLSPGGYGTLFRLIPPTTQGGAWRESMLHAFPSSTNDASGPAPGLTEGSGATLYGASGGGAANLGTIFTYNISTGSYGLLHSFGDGSVTNDGTYPRSSPIIGSDGNLYGTTNRGGSASVGTIYQITQAGKLTIYHSFGDGSVTNDGQYPDSGLVQGGDGNFYGATAAVGSAGNGTIFKFSINLGPYWNAVDVAAAADGTARLLWSRTDGAAMVWTLDATDTKAIQGPTYGPYSDSGNLWTAKSIGVASDGTSHILWTRSDNAVGMWTMNSSDVETTIGPTYGPVYNWQAIDLATATDGTSRILWDGAYTTDPYYPYPYIMGLWTMSAADVETNIGPDITENPQYPQDANQSGTAVDVASDGTARILEATLTSSADELGVLNPTNSLTSTVALGVVGVGYDIGGSADGTSQVLFETGTNWLICTFNASGTLTVTCPNYNVPNWHPIKLGSSGGIAKVLWVRTDRAAGIWTLNSADAQAVIGPTYGPY